MRRKLLESSKNNPRHIGYTILGFDPRSAAPTPGVSLLVQATHSTQSLNINTIRNHVG